MRIKAFGHRTTKENATQERSLCRALHDLEDHHLFEHRFGFSEPEEAVPERKRRLCPSLRASADDFFPECGDFSHCRTDEPRQQVSIAQRRWVDGRNWHPG
jgi:hypothetical protein